MVELPSMALEWFGAGALLVVLGYLIRFRQWTFLLAGYDKLSPVPDDVAANVAGNTVLRVGLATALFGVLMLFGDVPGYLLTAFDVVVLLVVARLLYRLQTHTPARAA